MQSIKRSVKIVRQDSADQLAMPYILTSSIRRFAAVAVGLLGTAAIPAFGWYDQGHMEVARIAYKRLRPEVRQRADDLLKLNPYYRKWLEVAPPDATPETKGLYVFVQAATWPDAIKNDQDYKSDGKGGGYVPVMPVAAQNIGYSDHYLHKYWHFSDHGFTKDGTAIPPDPAVDIDTQIKAFRQAIAAPDLPDEIKSYDLTWLMHLVGDVHQPLHCAQRISKSDPEGDAGGNKVKLAGDGPKNLHSFWDGCPGAKRSARTVLAVEPDFPRVSQKAAQQLDERTWADESFKLAKKYAYTGPIKVGDGPFTLDEKYMSRAKKIAMQRVELAGERLANVLNAELK